MTAQFEATPFYLPEGIEAISVLPEEGRFTAADFTAFCVENPDSRLEMTSEGRLIVMHPATPDIGRRSFLLTGRFGVWATTVKAGLGFASSAGFTLPNRAIRSPTLSWVHIDRWEALTEEEKETFSPICPDFVVELRSKTDRLKKLQDKMEEYIQNGAQLGWLIDLKKNKVHVYRSDVPVEILDNPREISGEPLLKGFTLKLEGILD